jgi:hypothetical protein
MRLTPTQRLLATAVALLACTAVVWWIVGYPIGKTLIDSTGGLATFRKGYSFQEPALVRLFALALLVPVTLSVVASVSAQARWLALGLIVAVAVLVLEEKGNPGGSLGVALFVLAASAVSEGEGKTRIPVALVAGLVVAFAQTVDSSFSFGEKLIVMVLRAVFFFGPLLVGPHYIETWLFPAARGKGA